MQCRLDLLQIWQLRRPRSMEGGGRQRHALGHPERCRARDEKLLRREELAAMGSGRHWCPCKLCCRTTKLLHSTVLDHLRRFGRHERCRATVWVSVGICLVSMHHIVLQQKGLSLILYQTLNRLLLSADSWSFSCCVYLGGTHRVSMTDPQKPAYVVPGSTLVISECVKCIGCLSVGNCEHQVRYKQTFDCCNVN